MHRVPRSGADSASKKGELKMRITFGLIVFTSIMTSASTHASVSGSVDLVSLADSLEPLKNAFNAHSGKPRLVAILSPT